MNSKYSNIAKAVVLLSVMFFYFLGVIKWKTAEASNVPSQIAEGKRLYFLCFSSALYMATFVGLLFAQPNWLKVITIVVNSVCAVILYEEFRNGDKQWTQWSYWLIIIFSANCMLQYMIIEKLKSKRNGSDTNNR